MLKLLYRRRPPSLMKTDISFNRGSSHVIPASLYDCTIAALASMHVSFGRFMLHLALRVRGNWLLNKLLIMELPPVYLNGMTELVLWIQYVGTAMANCPG